MSVVSDSRGCNNINCPAAMRLKCERAVPLGTGGAVRWTPMRNNSSSDNSKLWCDGFAGKDVDR